MIEYNDEDEEDIYGEIVLPPNYTFEYSHFDNHQLINGFKEITNRKITSKFNSLYNEIENETSKIYLYFKDKTDNFPKIFEKKSLDEVYEYLASISIPTKCECAGIIDKIPGWRCIDCSKYENTIYCSNCYINSKHLHKNHKVEFLYSSGGMCDCGDPDSLYLFCPEHCGPYTEQKQIDDYIVKSFDKNILQNLKLFFDDLFFEFSKYLLLTEKCKYFSTQILKDNLKEGKEKEDVLLLKKNFGIIFQNLLTFLFKITENNLGMLHLIASYFLKNNLSNIDNDEQSKTTHSCIKIEKDNIEILYKVKNDNENIFLPFNFTGEKKHKCECPFLRLLFSNWRDNIKSYNESDRQNEKFLLSFSHNLFLRSGAAVIIFFLYKEIIFNNSNEDVLYTRNQFYMEDSIEVIAKKTDIIEETYEFLFFYMKSIINSPKSKDVFNSFKPGVFQIVLDKIRHYMNDCKYFTKPKIRQLMYSKTSIFKRLIDISCLIHKQMEYKSIYPHPAFIEKKYPVELINSEIFIIYIANVVCLYTQWENINIVKELFNYFIEKITFLNKNKVLKKDEFSFHIPIYRIFGSFLNFFCFNYALNNKTDINTAIKFIKEKLFSSKDEMENIINIILNDYYQMYGFIIGIRNEYFNYYDLTNYNFIYFNDLRELKKDYTLLKYLIAMTEQKINLEYILEMSNIEYVYTLFNKVFISDNKDNPLETDKQETKEEKKNGFMSFFSSGFSYVFKTVTSYFDLFSYFKKGNKDDKEDENKHVMQWKRILEIIISIIKNDTTPLWEILTYFNEAISLKTKNILFDSIKQNNNLMQDCRNMLKERLVQVIIANGNLVDLKSIEKGIDSFFFTLFERQEFNNILDELTINKMNGEKKEFYLKDSCLKYLDMNYYYSPITKSKAELYIIDFKKDVFKVYNSYYYKPSEFTFDFYQKAYENILLNKENIHFFIKIIKTLLNPVNKEDVKKFDLNSIRKVFLPFILNFISMFASINSKTFIQFKIENEQLINQIIKILNDGINYNMENSNILFDEELEENIFEVIKQLNKYKTIREYINDDFSKLNDKDYYTNFDFKEQKENDNNLNKINAISEFNTVQDKKKNKSKDIKAHLKSLINKKSDKFLKKASKNKDMKLFIEANNNKEDKNTNEDIDEIMCFFCRNQINLKNYDKPYGKLGLIFNDFFYYNSFVTTVNTEINNFNKNNNNKENIFSNIINYRETKIVSSRITSCGHYFHQSCFMRGNTAKIGFKCPLCEKNQNILIPPLIHFYGKNEYLQSMKLNDILNKSNNINNKEIFKELDIFKNITIQFIKENINVDFNTIDNSKEYNYYINFILIQYQSYINFLINLFYSKGTTFHKLQQIDIIENLLLSLRYLTNINYININEIIDSIKDIINKLKIGPNISETILFNYEDLYYHNLFDQLLLSFSILLDYDELKSSFIYLINWILPYMSFWIYLRYNIIKNNFYICFDDDILEDLSIKNLKDFLDKNNTLMINYLKLYLQKLFMIKMVTNHNTNKTNDINYNLKELSLEQLFSLLNMDNLYQSLSKNTNNEITFTDLFEKIPKLFNSDNNNIIYDSNKLFDILIDNLKKQIKNEQRLVKPEIIAQFIPFEFKLISLDNNMFDWIEKCLFKKCSTCLNYSKYYYICLICGEKVCNTNSCNKISRHIEECGGGSGIFIYISNAKITLVKLNKNKNELYPLYVNDSGVGPSGYQMENDYYLSQEKYNLALKNYISNDFQ